MDEPIISQNRKRSEGPFLFLWETIKIIILALVIIIPFRYFIAQPFFVKGASMEHTFEDDDYLIINEIGLYFSEPKRGDVVVFRYPEDPKQYFIKRVIGLPNETVEISGNKVKIFRGGGFAAITLEESGYLDSGQVTEGELKTQLGEDEYFVMGDNRLHSSDSRRWGPLGRRFIVGKVFIRAWPLSEIKYFTPAPYPQLIN